MNKKKIGLHICLTSLGIERAEIARKAGIHPTYISHVLSGRKPATSAIQEAFVLLIAAKVVEELEDNGGK